MQHVAYNQFMTSLILLCAGASQRFGSPKALAKINQETILSHLQKRLIDSSIDEIVIVFGEHSEQIKHVVLKHNKIRVVHNKDHKFGQTSSIKEGLKNVSKDSESFFLLPIDCPNIKISTFHLLIERLKNLDSDAIIPAYQGQKGHPPIFNHFVKEQILLLSHSKGANVVFKELERVQVVDIDDPGIIQTFNTPDEFQHLKDNL